MKCGVKSVKKIIPARYGMLSTKKRGKVLAYVFGRRKDEVFLQLKAVLEPFGIRRFYTNGAWSV
jgi:IS1 family transposase